MTKNIYTRTGDTGQTGLFGGGRVPKSDPRVDAYGEVDELNACMGWAATQVADETIRGRLVALQPDLLAIGAHLATSPDRAERVKLPPLPVDRATEMERWMDDAAAELPELRSFLLPGGSPGGAALHLARTVCRRAERAVVSLGADQAVPPEVLLYLNRLSDLLFMLARLENERAGRPEERWEPRAG